MDDTRGQKKRVYWYSHQSVHPQIFPSGLIALVNSWRLFICCRLMQPKSHYVWMDAVPFCRAARQIWVTLQVLQSFKINTGVSCHQNLWLTPFLIWHFILAIMCHLQSSPAQCRQQTLKRNSTTSTKKIKTSLTNTNTSKNHRVTNGSAHLHVFVF